jgi:ParB/RepB/Spo0J family partition protein
MPRRLSDRKIPLRGPPGLSDRKIRRGTPREPAGRGGAGTGPDLECLAASIEEHGLLVPVLIEPDGTVCGGARRLAALRSLGRESAECLIIPPGTDPALTRLIDNVQRRDLTPLEEAHAFRRILDHTGWKQVRLARELGISETRVSLALNLVKPNGAPPEVLAAIERGEKSAYTVKCAFSEAGRRDGRAQQIEEGLERAGGAGGDVVHVRFCPTGVRVPARCLPEGFRARAFPDRVEVAFTLSEDDFPLSRLPRPDRLADGLAKAVGAALGRSEPQAMKALIAGLREAHAKALRMNGEDVPGRDKDAVRTSRPGRDKDAVRTSRPGRDKDAIRASRRKGSQNGFDTDA